MANFCFKAKFCFNLPIETPTDVSWKFTRYDDPSKDILVSDMALIEGQKPIGKSKFYHLEPYFYYVRNTNGGWVNGGWFHQIVSLLDRDTVLRMGAAHL